MARALRAAPLPRRIRDPRDREVHAPQAPAPPPGRADNNGAGEGGAGRPRPGQRTRRWGPDGCRGHVTPAPPPHPRRSEPPGRRSRLPGCSGR